MTTTLIQCAEGSQIAWLGASGARHVMWCASRNIKFMQLQKPAGAIPLNPYWHKVIAINSYMKTAKDGDVWVWMDADTLIVRNFSWLDAFKNNLDGYEADKVDLAMVKNKLNTYNTGIIVGRVSPRTRLFYTELLRAAMMGLRMGIVTVKTGRSSCDQSYMNSLIPEHPELVVAELPRKYNDYAFALRPSTESPLVRAWHGTIPRDCVLRQMAAAATEPLG